MKTNDLIDWLARGAGPTEPDPAPRALALLMPPGVLLAAALALGVIGPLPAALWAEPAPWLKLLLAAGAALLGLAYCSALARPLTPVARLRAPRRALGATLGVVLALGALALWQAPAGTRLQTWLGHSWWVCPLAVLGCALPALGLALFRLRDLAPTRLRAAGAAAGLFAGGCGALGYALACEELSMAFVATWYVLGVAGASLLGALLGPRLLRW